MFESYLIPVYVLFLAQALVWAAFGASLIGPFASRTKRWIVRAIGVVAVALALGVLVQVPFDVQVRDVAIAAGLAAGAAALTWTTRTERVAPVLWLASGLWFLECVIQAVAIR